MAAIGFHGYSGVLVGYELCQNGHICFRVDIRNAVKYARNSEHLSRTQNATCGNPMSSPDSVIIHPYHAFGTSIAGAGARGVAAGALNPAWSECFL